MLPIVAYGSPFLRKTAVEIQPDYPELTKLIKQMFNSMHESRGVGLAAPQIGKSIRLFIIDATPYEEDDPLAKDFIKVFINPRIIEETGKEWIFNEGCLSIPGINEDVKRKQTVEIEYQDEHFKWHREVYTGILGRIIQHEYDHLDGKLFVDKLQPLTKTLIKGKLNKIAKGDVQISYKMIFNKK